MTVGVIIMIDLKYVDESRKKEIELENMKEWKKKSIMHYLGLIKMPSEYQIEEVGKNNMPVSKVKRSTPKEGL